MAGLEKAAIQQHAESKAAWVEKERQIQGSFADFVDSSSSKLQEQIRNNGMHEDKLLKARAEIDQGCRLLI